MFWEKSSPAYVCTPIIEYVEKDTPQRLCKEEVQDCYVKAVVDSTISYYIDDCGQISIKSYIYLTTSTIRQPIGSEMRT